VAASRDKLLETIAELIADYREGELNRPNPEHVDRWIRQFDSSVQLSLLRELAYTLGVTYFTRNSVAASFSHQI